MSDELHTIVSVGPLITEDGNILLVREGEDGFWKLPGGKIAAEDTSVMDTVVREAKEELGIEVSLGIPLDPYLFRAEGVVRVLIPYTATREGEIEAGEGVDDWGWFPADALPENTAPNVISALQSLLRIVGEE